MSNTIGVYLRLSDEDNSVSESESIIGQRALIKNYIASDDLLSTYRQVEICDDGYSGTDFNRPGIIELLEAVRAGEINVIIVKDMSRFGRSYLEVGNYLEEVFPFLGVRFISVNDHYDSAKSSQNYDFLSLGFQNLLYDFYSKDLSQKITSVRRSKAKQGKFITAYAPYGYKKSAEQRLVVDEEAAEVVRRIFDLALSGMPKAHIARLLNAENIPSPLTLRKMRKDNFPCYHVKERCVWRTSAISLILKDRRYVGDAVYGKLKPIKIGSDTLKSAPQEEWIIVENTHEPIITREQFEKAATLFAKRSYSRSTLTTLQGKIRCGVCGHTLSPDRRNGKVTYRCRTPNLDGGYSCYRDSISESDLEGIILNYLGKLSASICDFKDLNGNDSDKNGINADDKRKTQKIHLEAALEKIATAKFALYESYKEGKIDKASYLREKADFVRSAEKTMEKLALVTEKAPSNGLESSEDDKCAKALKKIPFEGVTREMVEVFVEKITVKEDGKVEVRWDFGGLI